MDTVQARKQFFNTFLLIVFCATLMSCGNDPVSMVKEGTLSMDKTVKVGNALDGYQYFSKKKWETIKDPQQRTIVQFTGDMDMNAHKEYLLKSLKQSQDERIKRFENSNTMSENQKKEIINQPRYEEEVRSIKNLNCQFIYVAQFAINQDGKTFSLRYSGLKPQSAGYPDVILDDSLMLLRSLYKNEIDMTYSLSIVNQLANDKMMEAKQ